MLTKTQWPSVKQLFKTYLYAYDPGKEPEKVEAPKAKSAFRGINQTNFKTDFGSATTQKNQVMGADGKPVKNQFSLDTNTQLADFIQPIPSMAGGGVQNNLNYLQQSPQQQFADVQAGNNPLYNLLQQQTQSGVDKAIGRSMVDNSGLGTRNSTTAGAARGTILNDALLRDNGNVLNAINFGNEQGRANLGANLGALTGLSSLTNPLGAASNANLMQVYGAQDAIQQANASAQLQANIANANAANQMAMQQGSSLGNIIGGGIGLAGTLGGAAFGGPMGASLGGSLGNLFKNAGSPLGQGGYNLQQGLYQPKFETGIY